MDPPDYSRCRCGSAAGACCFFTGWPWLVFGEAGTLYSTLDDGQNWKRQQIPTRHLLLGGVLVDNDRGWLVGAGSTILQTQDGGRTWQASSLGKRKAFVSTRPHSSIIGWAGRSVPAALSFGLSMGAHI